MATVPSMLKCRALAFKRGRNSRHYLIRSCLKQGKGLLPHSPVGKNKMEPARNIYRFKRYDYQQELDRIEQAATTGYNKRQIRAYHNHLSAKGSGQCRICKLSGQFRRILGVYHGLDGETRDLSEATQNGFEQVVGWINNNSGWTIATKADYRRALKQFFSWFEEVDPRLREPPEIDITASKQEQNALWKARQEALRRQAEARRFYDYLKKHVPIAYQAPQRDPSDVITDEDIRKVIRDGARNSRDRALLGVLHEGGLRAGELLNLRIKDIEPQADRVLLHVQGKTGRRPVPIILNLPYLMRWLDDHPFKESREAYVWVGLSSCNRDKPIYHSAAVRMVDRAFKRAGVKKQHNLHWFRHSRASLYYGKMTEGEMCDFFGWTRGSDMVRTYSHTKNDGAQAALNRIYKLEGRQEVEALRTCAACGLHNEAGIRYCGRCGRPLSTEAHEAKEDYLKVAFEMMGRIYQDPALRDEFESRFKKS